MVNKVNDAPPAVQLPVTTPGSTSDITTVGRQRKARAIFNEAMRIARDLSSATYSQAQVSALKATLEHLRWAASRLSPTEFSEKQPTTPALAIQINTTLDLGQGGAVGPRAEASVYKLEVPISLENPDKEPIEAEYGPVNADV